MLTISEKIFKRLKENHMSQAEFARQTGISTSTINDWKIKGNIPSADKIMSICHALEMTPEELLTEDDIKDSRDADRLKPGDRKILDVYHSFSEKQQKRMMFYMKRLAREKQDDDDIHRREAEVKE